MFSPAIMFDQDWWSLRIIKVISLHNRTILLANNIRLMSKEVAPTFSRKDVHTIRDFATNKNVDVFEVLAKSLAPSIHGHEYIKKAVLCMLLGGSEKVLDNGTRLRGSVVYLQCQSLSLLLSVLGVIIITAWNILIISIKMWLMKQIIQCTFMF